MMAWKDYETDRRRARLHSQQSPGCLVWLGWGVAALLAVVWVRVLWWGAWLLGGWLHLRMH